MTSLTIQTTLVINDGLTLASTLAQLQNNCEDILVLVNDTYCKIYNTNYPGQLTYNGNSNEQYYFKDFHYNYTVFGRGAALKFYPALTALTEIIPVASKADSNIFTLIDFLCMI